MPGNEDIKSRMQLNQWQKKLQEAAISNDAEGFALAARYLTPSQIFAIKDSEGRNVFQMSLRNAENGDITKTAAYQYITQDNPNAEASDIIARAAWQLDDHNYSILDYLEAHVKDPGGVTATMLRLKENLGKNPKYHVSEEFQDHYDQLLLVTRTPLAYGYNRKMKGGSEGEEASEHDDNGNYYGTTAAKNKRQQQFDAEVEKNRKKYGNVGPGPRGGRDSY